MTDAASECRDVAARYAFALAYQWWLNCDAYFVAGLQNNTKLDGTWIREIGSYYGVNRTVPTDKEGAFSKFILQSGQSSDMEIDKRAVHLTHSLQQAELLAHKGENGRKQDSRIPASAATKVSWFVWPQGWTMYDSYAARGVLGTRGSVGTARMERFYAALAHRGWKKLLFSVRGEIPPQFSQLLAERTLDKHVLLLGLADGMDGQQNMERVERQMNAFLGALSPELGDLVWSTGCIISKLLRAAKLGHHENNDRTAIDERLKELRKMNEGIA